MKTQLPHTVGLYIDMAEWGKPPQVDDYVVTIGSRGVGSLYHIAEVTKVTPREPTRLVRYNLRVYKVPELLSKVHYNPNSGHASLEVESNPRVLPITWYKR